MIAGLWIACLVELKMVLLGISGYVLLLVLNTANGLNLQSKYKTQSDIPPFSFSWIKTNDMTEMTGLHIDVLYMMKVKALDLWLKDIEKRLLETNMHRKNLIVERIEHLLVQHSVGGDEYGLSKNIQ